MLAKASVTSNGAVLLGEHVACDSHDATRSVRVITHAHYDHLMGLNQSLRKCEAVVMTPATRELLEVLHGSRFMNGDNVKTLNYGETLSFNSEHLTLYPSDHIFGSAQVLVETDDGTRCVYTSDFRMSSKIPILKSDVLVIEATYGNPLQIRSFDRVVENALISLVEQGLKRSPVYIFGYHGKLQEIMNILYNGGVKAPFIVPEKIFQFSKVCERHGLRLGKYMLSTEDEARVILEKGEPCIAFYHMSSHRYTGKDAFRIRVTGWEFSSPRRQVGDNEHVIALSDHSDFNGLLSYVRESKPTLVIADNYRAGAAKVLTREITKRLGISAKALPT
jgi:putative mRNA 3-end processing factor